MQFYADDGRLGKATKPHKALKVLIPRSIANNSKGYTMALNAAAVWIYWALKRYRKPGGFSCWSWTPYQTLQATLFYLCAPSRNVCSVWKKQSYGNTTDWLILKSNREQNSDVSPEPCGRELVERHWCVVKTLSVEPEAVASPRQEGTFHQDLAMPTICHTHKPLTVPLTHSAALVSSMQFWNGFRFLQESKAAQRLLTGSQFSGWMDGPLCQ